MRRRQQLLWQLSAGDKLPEAVIQPVFLGRADVAPEAIDLHQIRLAAHRRLVLVKFGVRADFLSSRSRCRYGAVSVKAPHEILSGAYLPR